MIPWSCSQHFLSAGVTTNDTNETQAVLKKKERENTKMGKTEDFKRKLFPVVCLNIIINQEMKHEKDHFSGGF